MWEALATIMSNHPALRLRRLAVLDLADATPLALLERGASHAASHVLPFALEEMAFSVVDQPFDEASLVRGMAVVSRSLGAQHVALFSPHAHLEPSWSVAVRGILQGSAEWCGQIASERGRWTVWLEC